MLCTAHRLLDGTPVKQPSKSGKTMVSHFALPDSREGILYKAVHRGHPCTKWVTESSENYKWAYDLFTELCKEYTYRYGKTHKCQQDLLVPLKQLPTNIPQGGLTEMPLAMGSNPECMFEDAVKSYRAFYQTKQARFAMKWTKRKQPEWFHAIV